MQRFWRQVSDNLLDLVQSKNSSNVPSRPRTRANSNLRTSLHRWPTITRPRSRWSPTLDPGWTQGRVVTRCDATDHTLMTSRAWRVTARRKQQGRRWIELTDRSPESRKTGIEGLRCWARRREECQTKQEALRNWMVPNLPATGSTEMTPRRKLKFTRGDRSDVRPSQVQSQI